ncbi:hypothetical protein Tco_1268931, partial [Tanacetum coccineum]
MDKSQMNIVHRLSNPGHELGVMKFIDFAYRDKDKHLEIPYDTLVDESDDDISDNDLGDMLDNNGQSIRGDDWKTNGGS